MGVDGPSERAFNSAANFCHDSLQIDRRTRSDVLFSNMEQRKQ